MSFFQKIQLQRLNGLSTISKLTIGFVAGATVIGGVATAANSLTSSSVVTACADSRTGALYASVTGTCTGTRIPVTIGGGSLKNVVSKVEPSVVTVNVLAADGTGDTGSGSVIQSDAKGSYIVTNNHVIDATTVAGNNYTLTIDLSDGTRIPATLVGRDISYDLAVLHVSTPNLPVIPMGDSSAISIGDPVIAFGSPLGLNGTVTAGIVSSLNRPVTTQSTNSTTQSYVDAIQTDAAINPGNSGGPLTDSQGRLIGINSAIASAAQTGSQSGSIGLGFAIPINEAQRTINEIINTPTHTSTRPVLGVYFDQNYTGTGAKIAQLVSGGAAEKAGLVVGTIITQIGTSRIPDAETAIVRIRAYAPGSTVSITATLPSGGSKVYSVTLGSAPSNS
jgi:S1-C subfamily serine protease